jgi:hypothetical protein
VGNPRCRLHSKREQAEPDAEILVIEKSTQRRQGLIRLNVQGDVRCCSQRAAHQHAAKAHNIQLAQADLMEIAPPGATHAGDAMLGVDQER